MATRTDPRLTPTGRVLRDFNHGGHAVPVDGAPHHAPRGRGAARTAAAAEADGRPPGTRPLETALAAPVVDAVEADFENNTAIATTRFGYLFGDLADDFPRSHLPIRNHAQVVAHLRDLGAAMAEQDATDPVLESRIPAIYTYWGQFIDHDLTANTDRPDSVIGDITEDSLAALHPDAVTRDLRNLRHPALNLDAVYGDGPKLNGQSTDAQGFYSGVKFRIGQLAGQPGGPIPGVAIPPAADRRRDLRRVTNGAGIHDAQIADPRNDENLVVSQLHVAFLRFHNAVVDWIADNDPAGAHNDADLFAKAKLMVTRHYQWLVVHDYLETVTAPGTVDQIEIGGNQVMPLSGDVFMPLEFSVAAFRFGHSMIRGGYDHNRNFGVSDGVPAVAPFASLDQLFQFTGAGGLGGAATLPFNWAIEWDRFVHKGDTNPRHFARKIDTFLTPPLHQMRNQGNEPGLAAAVTSLLKDLAMRNLLRGYKLAIPTGQAVARELGVKPLTHDQLRQGGSDAVNNALEAGGFLDRTPLWFYVLKEAEVTANGNFLGEVGSRIVCETIIGQIRRDPDSYLNVSGGWTPADGVRFPGGKLIITIGDLLRFAGVLR